MQWKQTIVCLPCVTVFFSKCLWCVNLRPSTDCHCHPPWLLLWMLSGGICLSINLTNLKQGCTEFQYEPHYKKVRPVCDVDSKNAPLCFWFTWIAVINVFTGYLHHISLIFEWTLACLSCCTISQGKAELRMCLQPHWLSVLPDSLPLLCDYYSKKMIIFFPP